MDGVLLAVVAYSAVALAWSIFLASCAIVIHSAFWDKPMRYRDLRPSARIQRWVMNFLGGLAGFIAPAVIFVRFSSYGHAFDWLDLALVLVTFYGVTGTLPRVLLLQPPPWKS